MDRYLSARPTDANLWQRDLPDVKKHPRTRLSPSGSSFVWRRSALFDDYVGETGSSAPKTRRSNKWSSGAVKTTELTSGSSSSAPSNLGKSAIHPSSSPPETPPGSPLSPAPEPGSSPISSPERPNTTADHLQPSYPNWVDKMSENGALSDPLCSLIDGSALTSRRRSDIPASLKPQRARTRSEVDRMLFDIQSTSPKTNISPEDFYGFVSDNESWLEGENIKYEYYGDAREAFVKFGGPVHGAFFEPFQDFCVPALKGIETESDKYILDTGKDNLDVDCDGTLWAPKPDAEIRQRGKKRPIVVFESAFTQREEKWVEKTEKYLYFVDEVQMVIVIDFKFKDPLADDRPQRKFPFGFEKERIKRLPNNTSIADCKPWPAYEDELTEKADKERWKSWYRNTTFDDCVAAILAEDESDRDVAPNGGHGSRPHLSLERPLVLPFEAELLAFRRASQSEEAKNRETPRTSRLIDPGIQCTFKEPIYPRSAMENAGRNQFSLDMCELRGQHEHEGCTADNIINIPLERLTQAIEDNLPGEREKAARKRIKRAARRFGLSLNEIGSSVKTKRKRPENMPQRPEDDYNQAEIPLSPIDDEDEDWDRFSKRRERGRKNEDGDQAPSIRPRDLRRRKRAKRNDDERDEE